MDSRSCSSKPRFIGISEFLALFQGDLCHGVWLDMILICATGRRGPSLSSPRKPQFNRLWCGSMSAEADDCLGGTSGFVSHVCSCASSTCKSVYSSKRARPVTSRLSFVSSQLVSPSHPLNSYSNFWSCHMEYTSSISGELKFCCHTQESSSLRFDTFPI